MRTKVNLHSSGILPWRKNCEASLPSCVNILVHVHVHVVIVVVVVVLIVDCVDDGHREEGGGDEEAKEREDDEGATVAWVVAIPGWYRIHHQGQVKQKESYLCTQRASISNPSSRLTLFIAREENSAENCINSGSSQLSISVEAFLGPDPSPRLTWKSPSILITEPCSLCTGVRWITRRNCNIASSPTREGRALIIAIRQETSCPGPFMCEEDQMLGNKSQLLSQVAHSATTVLRVRRRISQARTILEFNILFGLVQFGQL